MRIYLAGSVPKEKTPKQEDWRKDYTSVITRELPEAEIMDPTDFNILEGDSKAVFGADCSYIKNCDLVVANAETKLGAGTAMEYVIAKYFNKPIITILPKDTHHRRTEVSFDSHTVQDWIHPFIDSLSDDIIIDISEVAKAFARIKSTTPKNLTYIDDAITYTKTKIENI